MTIDHIGAFIPVTPLFLRYIGRLASPLLLLYNGECGKQIKPFFYAYYPLHIMLLYCIGGRSDISYESRNALHVDW
ncbi:MAG: conjugal transfer protein TraX [Oscillospiraceae bacterium]|nr:conjugal transfer protein TraX [Oscillospiraceae bacterium]